MKLKNNGFTLIELLAVIVILGVLMVVAIPAMTRYIENSKKDVFADTAKKYISAARYLVISGSLECKDKYNNNVSSCSLDDLAENERLVIPIDIIDVENKTNKSPWGKKIDGNTAWVYVQADNENGKLVNNYYFWGYDKAYHGIIKEKESDINRSKVKSLTSTSNGILSENLTHPTANLKYLAVGTK